jgi:hypothetical protein
MRFPLFRFVSGLLQVFAWIVLILAIVAAILLVTVPQEWIQNVQFEHQGQTYMMTIPRWGGFFGLMLGGIIGWVSILALAGVLRLLTAIEENTFRGRPTVPPYVPPAYVPPAYVPPPPAMAPVSTAPPVAISSTAPPSSSAVAAATCTNCGTPLKEADTFCQSCGKKMGE